MNDAAAAIAAAVTRTAAVTGAAGPDSRIAEAAMSVNDEPTAEPICPPMVSNFTSVLASLLPK